MAHYDRLYHISIENETEIQSFLSWMDRMNEFPFSIYLKGKTYSFANYIWKDLWMVGFEAALEIRDEI